MVVDDHDGEPHVRRGGQRHLGGRAAIDRDHQPRTLAFQFGEDGRSRSIALFLPVRNIDVEPAPHGAIPAHQKGGARRSVDIIVRENHGGMFGLKRVDDQSRRRVHVPEGGWIGKKRLQRRIEKIAHRGFRHAARHERPRDGLGQSCDLT